MIIVVGGGRHLTNKKLVWTTLDVIHAADPITLLVHGDCEGADHLARDWAETRGVPCEGCPANWYPDGKHLDRSAGPRRNAQMLDTKHPDLVVAFPGGSGTADLVNKAKSRGIRRALVEGV